MKSGAVGIRLRAFRLGFTRCTSRYYRRCTSHHSCSLHVTQRKLVEFTFVLLATSHMIYARCTPHCLRSADVCNRHWGPCTVSDSVSVRWNEFALFFLQTTLQESCYTGTYCTHHDTNALNEDNLVQTNAVVSSAFWPLKGTIKSGRGRRVVKKQRLMEEVVNVPVRKLWSRGRPVQVGQGVGGWVHGSLAVPDL